METQWTNNMKMFGCKVKLLILFYLLLFYSERIIASEFSIATFKTKYAVGEPVAITVFIKNNKDEPIRVWPDAIKHQMIAIEVSEDGDQYKQLDLSHRIINVGTSSITLQPGETRGYVFRILVSESSFNKSLEKERSVVGGGRRLLFFARPGIFFIRARMRSRPSVTTHRLMVHVHLPRDKSLIAWKKINDPAMLYFLQFGRVLDSDCDVVKRAVEILREHENHAYYDDLAWALRMYYCNQVMRHGRKPFPGREPIRKLLALPLVENFFSAAGGGICYDRRLHVRQVVLQAGNFELDDLLRRATIQTGVYLSYDKRITGNSHIKYPGGVLSLRQFMQQLTEVGTAWVRDGDGYRLEVVPAGKK